MYKAPPRYEIALNDRVMNILGIGVMLHIAMNVWVYSNPQIFPTKIKSFMYDGIYVYYYESLSFGERIFSQNGFPFFVLLCASLAAFFCFAPALQMLVMACCFKDPRKRGG